MSDENWIAKTIAPKSDQLNADDLVAGPITVTVVDVRKGDADQPVCICIEGRQPYKPCLSMRRVLVSLWGERGSEWIGRSMTLFCDPDVKWGGVAVGGIRISHLTDIKDRTTLMLSTAKAKRKAVTIEPLQLQAPGFLDIWRPKFKGAPPEAMTCCRGIASCYTDKDQDRLIEVTKSIEHILEDKWKTTLMQFSDATFTAIESGE